MKTSSEKASSSILTISGGILALCGFALMLEEVGRDFNWEDAVIGPYVIMIVFGLLLVGTTPFLAPIFGTTDEDLSRESNPDDASLGGNGDGGDGD